MFLTMRRKLFAGILLCLCIFCLGGCGKSSPTSPTFDRLVYVALGASDAVGIGAFPLDNGYVYRVRDGLKVRADTVELYNLGVSGKRISYIESTELPAALMFEPNVVTIWAGPNDIIHGTSVEDFEASLTCVLSQLRQSTSAVIVIANVPDMTQVPRFLIDPDADVTLQRIAAYNDAIEQQAAVYSVPIIDLFGGGYATDWDYVSIDGFHPSNEGHAKIAELFLDVILRYL
jgi:lysophospholipase L1-like esterase